MLRTDTDHAAPRARDRARRATALGRVHPNPIVGAVVVRDGEVLGEGWHDELRRPARRGQRDRRLRRRRPDGRDDLRLAGAVLPPGQDRRRAPTRSSQAGHRARRRRLRRPDREGLRPRPRASCATRASTSTSPTASSPRRARLLNQAFRKHARTGRPWVLFKSAMTLDGKVATRDRRLASGSPASRRASCAHRWRALVDAVVVGIGTALADDPQLTARVEGVHAPAAPRRLRLDRAACRWTPSSSRRRHEVPLTVVVSRAAPRAADRRRWRPRAPTSSSRPASTSRRACARALDQLGERGIDVDPARGRPAPGRRVPRRRRDRRDPPLPRAAAARRPRRRATRSRARASSASPRRCAR